MPRQINKEPWIPKATQAGDTDAPQPPPQALSKHCCV